MSVRYLFNTSGQYVAFMDSQNVFSPSCDWLGFVINGNEMYDVRGTFSGYILDDDRVARKLAEQKLSQFVPFKPMTPFSPYAPLARLQMAPLPLGYIDVFESAIPGNLDVKRNDSAFIHLLGVGLFAADNTFLGTVSRDRFDQKSMCNEYGPHGSKYATASIFNDYGPYGGAYGRYSPYNSYSTEPPRFLGARNGLLGILSANEYVRDPISPSEFVAWLKS